VGGNASSPGDPFSETEEEPEPRLLTIVPGLGAAWTFVLVALAVGAVLAVTAVWSPVLAGR
jgi:hypothetical protein